MNNKLNLLSPDLLHGDKERAEVQERQESLIRLLFAMGRIRGTPYMRRQSSVHRATVKYFSNSFVFKTEIEKKGLPRGSTPDLGAGGLRFESGRPDQNIFRHFNCLSEPLFTQTQPEFRKIRPKAGHSDTTQAFSYGFLSEL